MTQFYSEYPFVGHLDSLNNPEFDLTENGFFNGTYNTFYSFLYNKIASSLALKINLLEFIIPFYFYLIHLVIYALLFVHVLKLFFYALQILLQVL